MVCVFLSTLLPVCGAGCALLDGLELKLNLTILGIGVDRVKIIHPVKRRGGLGGNSSLDSVYASALSQRRLFSGVMLDARAF